MADAPGGHDAPATRFDSSLLPDSLAADTSTSADAADATLPNDASPDAADAPSTDAPAIDASDASELDAADAAPADAADAVAPDAADAGVPSSGLVGEWLCAGNTNDTSGNANNGTGTAVTFTTDRHGAAASACAFDGTSSHIALPNSASLNLLATWSLSAWVRPSSFSALAGIASKYQTINAKGPAVRLSYSSPFTGVDVDEATNTPDAASGLLASGTWSHLGVSVNGVAVSCYIDGVLAYSGTAGYTAQSNADLFQIGVDYANRFFAGSIDDLRLYNRPLSAAEIEALYLAP